MPNQAELIKRQQILANFGEFAIRSDVLDEVLTEACRLVAEAMGTGRAKVLEIQKDQQELLVRAGVGWAPGVVGTVRLPMNDRSSETYAIKAATPIISRDLATETRFDIPDFIKNAGIMAIVNVPIFVPGQRPYGVLQIDATAPREFGDDEIQFLRTYAMILGPVIDRLHLREERIAFQERLESSEALHRLLVDSWAQAVWEVDANGVVITGSPSWRAYTGQTVEEWLGYGWLDAIHPEDRSHAERQWRAAITATQPVDAEFRVRAPDGGWRWTNVRAAPVPGASGTIKKWAGMNIDIDARKQAEAALRDSEDRYRSLFESMDEGYLLADVILDENDAPVDICFVQANSAAIRIAGRDFTGRRMRDIDPHFERHLSEAYALVAVSGNPVRTEYYAAPHRRWFDFRLAKVGPSHSRRVACVFQDITERKLADAALRDSRQALAADLASAELLRSLAERLMPENSLQSIYNEVLSATIAITSADAGTVQLYDPATMTLDMIASRGFSRTITDYFDRVDATSRTACGLALRTGEYAFADFPGEAADTGCKLLAGEGIRAAVAYPLISRNGAPLGMLNAHWRRAGHRPNERELRFLGLLARQAADLIEQRRSHSALHESEERQRALIEGLPQLVWRASTPGNWTWASPQWTRFTGQCEEDSHGWGWLAPLHPDDREAARAAWAVALKQRSFEVEYRVFFKEANAYRWVQTRATPIRDGSGEIIEWLGTSTDVDDLRRLQERQQVLLAELQHRVRNILAVTRSMISRSNDGERCTEDYVAHLQGRIAALARTQVLLTRTAGTKIDLESLIRDEIVAQAASEDRISLTGEDVAISPKTAEVLTLAIHELATNATKYGAFSRDAGRLDVSWQVEARDGSQWLVILWREHGVPIVDAVPRREGFGTELIRRRIPYELKGYGSVVFRPGGLEARIEFPLVDHESILQTDAGGR